MKDKNKTKAQLINELTEMRQRVVELEALETERKQAEETLRREKEKFQVMVEEAPLGVSIIREDGHYDYINPRFVEFFGYTLEDIPTGKAWFTKAYPDQEYRNQVILTWITDLKGAGGSESRPRIFTVTCKDGSEKVIHFRPVTMETGDQFVIYEDISVRKQTEKELRRYHNHLEELVEERTAELTKVNQQLQREIVERKQAEKSLREAEVRYKTLFDTAPVAIFTKDRAGYYTSANTDTLTYWAHSPVGYTDADLLPPKIAAGLRAADLQVMETGQELVLEEQFQAPHGLRILLSRKIPLRDATGDIAGILGISLDITSHKQVEEALRESEEMYRTLVETSPDAVTVTNLEGHITYVSQRTLELHDFEQAEEVLGRSAFDLIALEDHEKALTTLQKTLKEERIRNVEFTMLKKDGTHFDGELNAALIKDVGGKPKALIATTRDITKRKRLEKQLTAIYQLGQKLSLLYDEAAVIQRVLETTTNLLRFEIAGCGLINEATSELCYRYSIPETETLSLPLTRPKARGISVAVIHSGQALNVPDVAQDPRYVPNPRGLPIRSELCVPIKVGQWVIGVLNVESVVLNNFTPDDQRLLQTLADQAAVALENARLHTKMQRHAQELSALHFASRAVASTLDLDTILQQAMIEAKILLEAEGASILLHDPPSDELVFATAASPGAEAMIGARVPLTGSIAGRVMEEMQPILIDNAQNDPHFYAQIDSLTGLTTRSLLAVPLMVNEEIIGVIETINKSGAIFDLHDLELLEALTNSVAVAIENARLYESLQEQMDVLQETQAQLVQSEKMAAVGRLSASIAHEINNPLQAIQNSLTLLEEEMDGQRRPEEMRCYLGIAEEEIERISEIMHRLRAFYRPTRQTTQTQTLGSLDTFYHPAHKELQFIDLTAILESVLHLVDRQLKDNQITIERNLVNNLPLIQGNPDHLKQVFLNLALNAVEAMAGQGGILHLDASPDQVQLDSGQLLPVVCLEFSDTGMGIPPEAIPHLFEPFFSTKEQGSGLGLSISYKIVEAHHGQINVESQVGMGTTFTVLLPIEQP